MLFRKIISVVIIGMFISCSEEVSSPTPQTPKMTIEEVQNFVNGLNFTGTLPSGNKIDFIPNRLINSENLGINFTNAETPNYSTAKGTNFDLWAFSNNNGVLTIFPYQSPQHITVNFEYVLIMTFGELEELYPLEVNIDESEKHFVLGLALGSRLYDIEDVLVEDNIYGVTDFIQVVFDPESFFNNWLEGIYITEGDEVPFFISGNFNYSKGMIESEGVIDYWAGGYYRIGDYNLLLEE